MNPFKLLSVVNIKSKGQFLIIHIGRKKVILFVNICFRKENFG